MNLEMNAENPDIEGVEAGIKPDPPDNNLHATGESAEASVPAEHGGEAEGARGANLSESQERSHETSPVASGTSPGERSHEASPVASGTSPDERSYETSPVASGTSSGERSHEASPVASGTSPDERSYETSPVASGTSPDERLARIARCRSRIEERICALTLPGTHPKVVAEEFFRAGPEVAVEAIHSFHRNLSNEGGRGAYQGIARLFMDERELPYHLKQPMYGYARKSGYTSVAYAFFRPPAKRMRSTGECLGPEAPESDKTLGERKSLARSLDRTILTRIVRDPDPSVVRNILKNPRMKESDIVRIAAARPVRAAVLLLVIQHPVWMLSAQVQLTVAQNPYTPTHISIALLPLLPLRILQEMGEDMNLHAMVNESARYLAQLRSRGKGVKKT